MSKRIMTCRFCRFPRTEIPCGKSSIRGCPVFKALSKEEQEEFRKSKNKYVEKRKNCENNFAEMLYPLKLLYPDISTKQDVLDKLEDVKENKKLRCSGNHSDTIDKYYNDILKRSDETIHKYLQNFPIFPGEIKEIILSGKSINEFAELISLNTNPDTNKLYDIKLIKSDLFIKTSCNKIIGISIKDSKGATLTNYSVEKIFDKMNISHKLREYRITILKNHFGEENYKYIKDQRDEANMLFYEKDNLYFKEIIKIIEQNEQNFTGILLSYVFPKLNYDIYGYNGTKFKDLNEISNKLQTQKKEIKRETKYETNKSAKLWYSLYLDDIESWTFCIRGKNPLWCSSMQILEFTRI